jgi:CubicO group peptidase (beta-lactamase class C family)
VSEPRDSVSAQAAQAAQGAQAAPGALGEVASWPVPHASAAVIGLDGVMETAGDTSRVMPLASLSKVISAWAVLIAMEEGTVSLDDAVGPPGATLRHLLAHASGLPFEGDSPIAAPATRRIYSNTGIEMAAAHVAASSAMTFGDYVTEAVLQPLGMTSTQLRGSAAHGIASNVDDMARFVGELLAPRLVAPETAREAVTAQWPDLAGIVPGIGRFDPCPWGLGPEIRGDKWPHWMGRDNSPATFGHFGGSGTMMWVDPTRRLGLVALTDRGFDEWAADALRLWSQVSDAVLATY